MAKRLSSRPSPDDPSWCMIRQGKFAKVVLDMEPDLVTFTFCRGSVDILLLTEALQEMLDKYPMLRGRAFKSRKGDYWIQQAYFSDQAKDYLEVIHMNQVDMPDDSVKAFEFLDQLIIPRCSKVLNVSQRVRRRLPLFGIQLVLLKDDHFCLKVMLSHILGDATTYYTLVQELVENWSGRSVEYALQRWDNPLVIQKELADNERDLVTVSGFPIAVGVFMSAARYGVKDRFHALFVDKSKLEFLKKELKEDDVGYLSSNDVLTAHLCQVFPCEMVLVSRNDRSQARRVDAEDAGCFFSVLALPSLVNPNDIRRAMNQGYYYKPGEIPRKPLYRGKHLMMTSWATAQRDLSVVPDGTELIAHIAHPSWVRDLPFAEVVVCQYTHDSLLLLHNIPSRFWDKAGMERLENLCVSK